MFQAVLVGVVGLLLFSTAVPANAVAIRSGVFTTNTLARNDDGSTGAVNIGFTLNFFGNQHSDLFVNNNGNVTFNSPLATFTPFSLTSTATEIIAPFFADVDTRNLSTSPVTYGTGTVAGRAAFGVNWINVGHYSMSGPPTNSFQLALIDRSDIAVGDFDIEFNYDQISWDNVGGSPTRGGFSNGTNTSGSFFEPPGSGISDTFLDSNLVTGLIHNSLNSSVDGRYVFEARSGAVNPAPLPPPNPVPSS